MRSIQLWRFAFSEPSVKIKTAKSRFILLPQLSNDELVAPVSREEVLPVVADEGFSPSPLLSRHHSSFVVGRRLYRQFWRREAHWSRHQPDIHGDEGSINAEITV
jgi:hypothetical protein